MGPVVPAGCETEARPPYGQRRAALWLPWGARGIIAAAVISLSPKKIVVIHKTLGQPHGNHKATVRST